MRKEDLELQMAAEVIAALVLGPLTPSRADWETGLARQFEMCAGYEKGSVRCEIDEDWVATFHLRGEINQVTIDGVVSV